MWGLWGYQFLFPSQVHRILFHISLYSCWHPTTAMLRALAYPLVPQYVGSRETLGNSKRVQHPPLPNLSQMPLQSSPTLLWWDPTYSNSWFKLTQLSITHSSQVCWLVPIIPALGRLGQEYCQLGLHSDMVGLFHPKYIQTVKNYWRNQTSCDAWKRHYNLPCYLQVV